MSHRINLTGVLTRRRIPATLTLTAFALFLVVLFLPLVGAQRKTAQQKASNQQNTVPVNPVNPCCGKKPPLKQASNFSSYASFTGQVAVATNYVSVASNPSVLIWDIKGSAPVGVQWSPNSYSHPDWTRAKLGDVFGLTLDGNGNIFVASSRVYGTNHLGSLAGTPGHADIYKLDGNMGTATRFVQTDLVNHTYTSGNKIPNTGPGLGNITYACAYDNFYVTNFEDGMIYRIDSSGNILSLWDHGHNLPSANPSRAVINDTDNIGTNPGAPFTQLGRRTWAVQVYNGRLYYSVWSRDITRTSNSVSNEIWSIALTATGAFTGSAKLEITVPPFTSGGNFSSPVSDISFTPSGNMLLAERMMTGDASVYAHSSRVLEYLPGWTASSVTKYQIGYYGTKANAAGGVDYDNAPGGHVWTTGDFLTPSAVYGLQGLPMAGGDYTTSLLIDMDGVLGTINKTQNGDVEIPCYECQPPPKPQISGPDTTCAAGTYCTKTAPGVTYTWTVTGGTGQVTNNGGCITINWGPNPGKSITVTATNAAGCTSTTTLNLKDCDIIHLGDCCLDFHSKANLEGLVDMGNGVYNFTTSLSTSPASPMIRVTADIISSSLTYSAPSCGTAGPVNSYVMSAGNVPGFTTSIPVANGHEVIWYGGGTSVSGQAFPIQIKFPPPPTGHCLDYLTFCVKYTFTDRNCKTCEVIVCYGPFKRGGIIKIPTDIKDMTDIKAVQATP